MPRPRRKRARQVLLLIETSRAYGRGLVEGIARYAERNATWSIFFQERGLTDPFPRWFKQWRGDGIISRTLRKADIDKLLVTRMPVVELYAGPTSGLPRVFQDEEMAARLAADHFLDRGFRNLAFFATDRAHWIEGRRRNCEQVLRDRGYPCRDYECAAAKRSVGTTSRHADDRTVIRWLKRLPKPCGVFCASDFYAVQLARACRGGGIIVPEQVAILGVDNDPVFCQTCTPRLSSLDLDSARIGYEAAALLDRLMAGKSPPEGGVSVAPRQVVPRESTDILAIEDADVVQAVRLMRERACQKLRIAQVADAVGLSRRVFEQRFRRVLRRSPKDEILRLRMERARMLLSTCDMSVALVAKTIGFASQEYFARAFRRRTGVTPRTYRQQSQLSGGSSRLP
jgi:LacI family transcriptional regulator